MYAVLIITECSQSYPPATCLTHQDNLVNIKLDMGCIFLFKSKVLKQLLCTSLPISHIVCSSPFYRIVKSTKGTISI